jgi:hypothetical protein
MVKVENIMDVQVLRSRLSELDLRFVRAGMKLYVSQVRATTNSRQIVSFTLMLGPYRPFKGYRRSVEDEQRQCVNRNVARRLSRSTTDTKAGSG